MSPTQSLSNDISDIDILLRPTTSLQSRPTTPDKLIRYLRSINLARDILTTPASGSRVERLFNSTRDIYHYRRGSLRL
ncbi:hypothetical protein N7492_004240 [Penicillium capsulatum]|uniref:HAT C-terminal dimerisation domain-containing protein n=1 Tax=Penicillium capsulatum TaxID=69766 RepID=A0A9W9IDE7_9EURO|nr:hypothetical protein N7492_004240 [Penicillium capsulatum]